MIINAAIYGPLCEKINRILLELDHAEFAKNAMTRVPRDRLEESGFFYSGYNPKQPKFFALAWGFDEPNRRNALTVHELLNIARETIRRGKDLLGIKEDNYEISHALRQLDQLDKVYNEFQKDLANDEMIAKLGEINVAVKTIAERQAALASSQRELRVEIDKKANKSDIPDIGFMLAHIDNSLEGMKKTIIEVKDRAEHIDVTRPLFKFF